MDVPVKRVEQLESTLRSVLVLVLVRMTLELGMDQNCSYHVLLYC